MGWARLSDLFRTFAELHDAWTKTYDLLLWDGNVCLTCLGPLLNFMMPWPKTFGLLLWGGNVCFTCLGPWLNFMMPGPKHLAYFYGVGTFVLPVKDLGWTSWCLDQNIWPTFMGWERLSDLLRTFDSLTIEHFKLFVFPIVWLFISLCGNHPPSSQCFGTVHWHGLLVSVAIILPVVSVSALSTDMVY